MPDIEYRRRPALSNEMLGDFLEPGAQPEARQNYMQVLERSLTWIDMDGVRRRRFSHRSHLIRALSRLHVSLLEVPELTRTDRVRFLRDYFAGFGIPHDEWRRWWPALVRAADRKQVALSARRAWKRRHYGRE